MAAPTPKPKFTKTTIIVYIIVTLVIVIVGAMLGTALDRSLVDGKVVIGKMDASFSYVTRHPASIITALFNTPNSYAPKMVFLGVFSFALYILYKWAEDAKRTHRKGVEHGSAKWGDEKEMRSLADNDCTYISKKKSTARTQIMKLDGKYLRDEKGEYRCAIIDNNILFSQESKLSLNARQHLLNHNVLIVGGSGAGKTRFYANPNIMQMNTSYVVTDPKGEILAATGKMLEAAGYEVKVLNLIEMEHSHNYNPFEYVYDYNGELSADNIKKMVRILFDATKGDGEKTDFWSQKGQTMLEAIVYLLFEESEYNMERDENGKLIPETRDKSHLNFFSVTEKMRKLRYPPKGSKQPDGFFLERKPDENDADFETRLNDAFLCPLDRDYMELQKRKPDTLAYRLYKEVRNAPEETGQSFLSSANVKTFMFNLPSLRNLTCCDNIHMETMGDRKTAMFIILSATDSTYNFMAAMMYTQMFDVLSNRANFKYKQQGQRLPVPVRCIMDEFANIGQIPDFEKVIAFVRSMGMSLNVIVQNTAQLKAKYEKTWEVITGNCDTFLFLGGKEESTLKYVSEALGKETIDVRGTNKTMGRNASTSENNSILGRELMQPNEISSMPISDCIVMMRSHNPFYCHKYPLEQHPNYQFTGLSDKKMLYDVSLIRSVSVDELEKQQQAAAEGETEKVDTNVNSSDANAETENPAEDKKVDTNVNSGDTEQEPEKKPANATPSEADTESGENNLKANTLFDAENFEVHSNEVTPESHPTPDDDSTQKQFGEPKKIPESVDFGEPIADRKEEDFNVEEDDEATYLPEDSDEDTEQFGEVSEEPESLSPIPADVMAVLSTSDEPFGEFSNDF